MRFTRYLVLGLLTVLIGMSVATADDSTTHTRNLGATSCRQTFSCSQVDQTAIAGIAYSCSLRAFGFSSAGGNIFDGAVLDGDNCMSGQLPSNSVNCCVTADGDTCSMQCTFH